MTVYTGRFVSSTHSSECDHLFGRLGDTFEPNFADAFLASWGRVLDRSKEDTLMMAVPMFIAMLMQLPDASLLRNPDAPEMHRQSPPIYRVRVETTKGDFIIGVHRDWAPIGSDHFYDLVRAGYSDDTRFFRVVADRWVQ
jgi:Cyclophilin type peptidyl-prolyl cis-trans isomerase/CLD